MCQILPDQLTSQLTLVSSKNYCLFSYSSLFTAYSGISWMVGLGCICQRCRHWFKLALCQFTWQRSIRASDYRCIDRSQMEASLSAGVITSRWECVE
ncbi:hypothetical protein OH492_00950 [Vibrio chagasii]|nr:hypothetical protein [Vibrio chagasii]